MNKDLTCNIHKGSPIFHINIQQDSQRKLQCIKCFSNKQTVVNLLVLEEIINSCDNSFFDTWPPLSDEDLRKKIINLKNEDKDILKPIEEFYDNLQKDMNQVLLEKKKEQINRATKIHELKKKIIEKYQKMASINQIKQHLTQEEQSIEKIEANLKEQIDSQFKNQETNTSILTLIMKYYENISELNQQIPNQIKENLIQILKVVNLIPHINFNLLEEIDKISLENIEIFKQNLENEEEILKKDKVKIQMLIEQLDICTQQLTQKIHQKNWYLDKFLNQQSKLLFKNQIEQAEFQKDIYKNAGKIKYLNAQNQKILSQINFKYYDGLSYKLRLQDSNSFILSTNKQVQNYLQVDSDLKSFYNVSRIKNGLHYPSFYLNYKLKPLKKYLFKFNFTKTHKLSTFFVGLIKTNQMHNIDLNRVGLGLIVGDQVNKPMFFQSENSFFFQSASTFFQSASTFFLSDRVIESNIRVNQNIFGNSNQKINDFIDLTQENREEDSKKTVQKFKLQVCLKNQQIKLFNLSDKNKVFEFENKNLIEFDENYNLGFEFYSDHVGDRFEILNCQELDEFPKAKIKYNNFKN